MKEYPKGSVCVIIDGYEEYIGKECTVEDGLAERQGKTKEGDFTKGIKYSVTVQGYGNRLFNAVHEQLRLKRFPGELNSKCEEFMKKVLKPVEIDEEETV